MITLFGYPQTRSTRVAWMLEELGVDYNVRAIDLMQGEGYSEDYRKVNPAGKIPALRDGDLVLTESAAINTYLGDKFNNRELVPAPGTPERGRYEQWCYFAMCELEQPLWTMGKHRFAIPEQYRVAAVMPTAEWEFQQALALFEKGLGEQPWILGDTFSAADIMLAHTLMWAVGFKQPVAADNLRNYLDRAKARPALQRAVERQQAAADNR